jgi:hypothetical protein
MKSIVQATRAHYAALQHRPSPERVALDYEVIGHDGRTLNAGTVWVKAKNNAQRKANMTKLKNQMRDMYPFEIETFECKFRGNRK